MRLTSSRAYWPTEPHHVTAADVRLKCCQVDLCALGFPNFPKLGRPNESLSSSTSPDQPKLVEKVKACYDATARPLTPIPVKAHVNV